MASARSTVAAAADVAAEALDDAECRALLLELTALTSQVAELELRVLVRAEQVRAGQQTGASSTASWLALETRQSKKATHAKARLARDVATGSPRVRAALAAGKILPAQAGTILQETAGLTRGRDEAVRDLIERAAGHDAVELRVRAREVTRSATIRREENPLALVVPAPEPAREPLSDRGSTVAGASVSPPFTPPPSSAPPSVTSPPPSEPTAGGPGHESEPRPSLWDRVQGWWGRRQGAHRRSRDASTPIRSSVGGLARTAHGALGWHVHLAETCPHETAEGRSPSRVSRSTSARC